MSADQTTIPIVVDPSSTSRDHCFKDMSNDFVDTSSSNCDLPQLFEGIDCINLKPPQYSSNENSSSGAHCSLADIDSPLKKIMYCS